MTPEEVRSYALHGWERKQRDYRNELRCVGMCAKRRPRTEFRETPGHGRSAYCKRCEEFMGVHPHIERQSWLLAQEREKSRMLRRHIARLRKDPYPLFRRRYVMGLTSAKTYESPDRSWYRTRQEDA